MTARTETDGAQTPAPRDFLACLRQLCTAFQARTGVDCRVSVRPEHARFDTVAADVLYHAIRELLTVVRKHARATELEVSSSVRDDGSVTINVAGEGTGATVAPERDDIDLWNIDQRLRGIGAYMDVIRGGGCISVVLPGQQIVVP